MITIIKQHTKAKNIKLETFKHCTNQLSSVPASLTGNEVELPAAGAPFTTFCPATQKQIPTTISCLKRGAQLKEVSLYAKMLYQIIALNWLVRFFYIENPGNPAPYFLDIRHDKGTLKTGVNGLNYTV